MSLRAASNPGVGVEPVEGHRAVEVAHVAARTLQPGGPIGPKLVEGPARERLVAGEKPGEREAGQVLGRPLPRRPTRLEGRQARERVAFGDEESGGAEAADSSSPGETKLLGHDEDADQQRDADGGWPHFWSFAALRLDRLRELQPGGLVGFAGLGEADRLSRVGVDARHDGLQHLLHEGLEARLPREGQVEVVLEPAAQVRELDGGDGPVDAPVLLRVQDLLPGVHEDAVPVDEALVLDGLVRLATVVERDRVRPHVLLPLALLLAVVLPVDAVPEEVEVEVVLERGPRDRARLGRGRVDERASAPAGGRRCRSRRAARGLARPRPPRGPAPAVGHTRCRCTSPSSGTRRFVRKVGRRPPGPGFELHVVGEPPHLRVLRRVGLVGQVEERQRFRAASATRTPSTRRSASRRSPSARTRGRSRRTDAGRSCCRRPRPGPS